MFVLLDKVMVIENIWILSPFKFSFLEKEEKEWRWGGTKFNAEKEMCLEELESVKKTLENSYFNLKGLFLDQVNIIIFF